MSLGCLPIAAKNSSQIEVIEEIGILYSSLEELIEALRSSSLKKPPASEVQSKALGRYSWKYSASHLASLFNSL
jgi:hypothetical protein